MKYSGTSFARVPFPIICSNMAALRRANEVTVEMWPRNRVAANEVYCIPQPQAPLVPVIASVTYNLLHSANFSRITLQNN